MAEARNFIRYTFEAYLLRLSPGDAHMFSNSDRRITAAASAKARAQAGCGIGWLNPVPGLRAVGATNERLRHRNCLWFQLSRAGDFQERS